MGLWDEHKPFWVVGGVAFVVSTAYTALRGGGTESVIAGFIIGGIAGAVVEIGIKKMRGDIL